MQSPRRSVPRAIATAAVTAVALAGLLYLLGHLTVGSFLMACLVAAFVGRVNLYWWVGGSLPEAPREFLVRPPPPSPTKVDSGPDLPRWRD